MKWTTKDCYGNTKTWYSEDVIEKIKKNLNEYCKQKIHDPDIEELLNYINEVDE